MAKEKRFVDLDVLIQSIEDEHSWLDTLDDFQALARMQPTVDAVEVVRCEDCLYRSQYPDESGHYKCGGLLTEDEELLLMVKPDFFCAYGERRGKDAVD